jgi:hypothetical protein
MPARPDGRFERLPGVNLSVGRPAKDVFSIVRRELCVQEKFRSGVQSPFPRSVVLGGLVEPAGPGQGARRRVAMDHMSRARH